MLKYTAPKYLKEAAYNKYGKRIYVIGATRDELQSFWSKFEKNAVEVGTPIEVGRTVVDIDAKSHINTGNRNDFNDSFKITSSASSTQTKASSSSYQLQLSVTKETQIGANLSFKIGGPAFFNLAGGGLTAGASHKHTKTVTETERSEESESQSLSQTYQIVEDLQVPAKTKVRALVKTFAVTYKAKSIIQFRVDANATIPVRYRSKFSRVFLGGVRVDLGKITVEDLFQDEDKSEVKDGVLTFRREGYISYLSEEVEVTKEETSI